MAFELFDKRMTPLAKAPTVTIQKRGVFSISPAAHKLINDAETVDLLYDRDNQIIAMRPASEDSPNAYPLRPQSSRETGQVVLSATAFTQYYDINTDESRRWVPYAADGMLCIDLTREFVVVRGNRAKKTQEAGTGTE